jgi:hypothetical protein
MTTTAIMTIHLKGKREGPPWFGDADGGFILVIGSPITAKLLLYD